MKDNKRLAKAIMVILVMGVGLICNTQIKTTLFNPSETGSFILDYKHIQSDSTKHEGSTIYSYTKKMIVSGIQHIISDL